MRLFVRTVAILLVSVWSVLPVWAISVVDDESPVDVVAARDEGGTILAPDDGGAMSVITNAAALSTNATAAEVLAACRAMLPACPVELRGSLILRNRKGIPLGEFGYDLLMDRTRNPARLSVTLAPEDETNVLARAVITRPSGASSVIDFYDAVTRAHSNPALVGRVAGTDVTWLDLTLDFLWWPSPAFEAERELESIHGQKCVVILVAPPAPIPGVSAVRLWVDRKTGCLMQAEQLDVTMKAVRRLWGTRVKRFNGRWMASVLEVETLGSGHRTKIVVDDLIER